MAMDAGFAYIDNNFFELDENLADPSENSKLRYKVSRGEFDDKELSLRFDNTKGFMRWCAEMEGKYKFPLRRFYGGKVFRGERAQKGRLKEFYQFDTDIVMKELRQSDIDSVISLLKRCVLANFPEIKLEELFLRDDVERGQDYYKGYTFEIWYKGLSVIAGGTYEIPFKEMGVNRNNMPAFGGSIGVDRIMALLDK
jgi:histidyl-tRNA synthetase